MTDPKPTPEEQNLSASPDEERSNSVQLPKRGFFDRIQQTLKKSEPVHPSEEKEIVIMENDDEIMEDDDK